MNSEDTKRLAKELISGNSFVDKTPKKLIGRDKAKPKPAFPAKVKSPELKAFLDQTVEFIANSGWTEGCPYPKLKVADEEEAKREFLGCYKPALHDVTLNIPRLMDYVSLFHPKGTEGRESFTAGVMTSVLFHEFTHARHATKWSEIDKVGIKTSQYATSAINLNCRFKGAENEDINIIRDTAMMPSEIRKSLVSCPLQYFPVGNRPEFEGTPIGDKLDKRLYYLAGLELPDRLKGENAEADKTRVALEFIAHMGMIHSLLGYAKFIQEKPEQTNIEKTFVAQTLAFGKQLTNFIEAQELEKAEPEKTLGQLPALHSKIPVRLDPDSDINGHSKLLNIIKAVENGFGRSTLTPESRIGNRAYLNSIRPIAPETDNSPEIS